MSAYIAQACTIVHKLIDAGHHISDDDLLLAITAGLPHFYDPFLVSIDTLSDSEYTLELIIP
ncbi:hypothetical protein P691DRAFT_841147 [Macrolepiota fuliginosa MF-IS2]|uniref:Uncharacterized protein n=1 Tax=Macrolepiota fuliginosa MF-IS2 TaxID=1400762 RepID=A0A9P5X2M6_9AGAR|nr:hypothetical protein P691DRAFT_841147 [Macrolepiota fuliginosa MF-IS2]